MRPHLLGVGQALAVFKAPQWIPVDTSGQCTAGIWTCHSNRRSFLCPVLTSPPSTPLIGPQWGGEAGGGSPFGQGKSLPCPISCSRVLSQEYWLPLGLRDQEVTSIDLPNSGESSSVDPRNSRRMRIFKFQWTAASLC